MTDLLHHPEGLAATNQSGGQIGAQQVNRLVRALGEAERRLQNKH